MIGCIVEDRYLIEEELGTGAMGRVFAARHVKVGRRVAIKVMHDELAKNPAIVERFAREAMIAARVRHPNLVSVLDVGAAPDGRPLIVLELAPGVPLSQIAWDGSQPGPRVINLISQLLRGLDHAHRAGLIHRDLKPDNILVETAADGSEVPRVVDFGIAITARPDTTVAGRRLTEANTVIGTPFYMSPEQARAKDVDHRTDLFSLGVIMYELLAGMPPFPGTSIDVAIANATREAPSIAERAGIEVDPLLEAFVRKLMARRVEQRFQSAREALDVLSLMERDRIAAARVLGGGPMPELPAQVVFEAPPLVRAMVRPNSDEMTTINQPVVTDACADAAVATDDDDFSDLDYSPRTAMRRRKRLALGIVMAVMAVTAAAGFSARQPNVNAETPSIDVTSLDVAEEVPAMDVASAPARASHNAQQPIALAQQPIALAQQPVALAQPPVAVAQRRIAVARHARTIDEHAVIAAVAAAPPTPTLIDEVMNAHKAALDVSTAVDVEAAAAVAAKYSSIAKALKHCVNGPETDALWARFRLIRYNDAIKTESSRRDALVALSSIESSMSSIERSPR